MIALSPDIEHFHGSEPLEKPLRLLELEAGILRLDADYQMSDALLAEIAALDANGPVNAYRVSFDYAVFSHRLRSSLYPANTVLLRRGSFSVCDKTYKA